ncbi:outer membrane protein assembly factor BamD [[Actinobacillus] muris]|uniref:Outer membrane protein assembly factor BamD n=1 Tax=Muribacter muris TaxID=67855 RepID=A0A0J5P9B4_9PAST|nr:outer membrane protein assembly factor BamD [Muribacter muris]KMK52305.1 outer membrane protein assembly factor BamD [[Actinobacillus] muris] [Muribacter muris]MBF0784731.1 outer membrane protein assembly factor BamD [Muribacter muris]MBF0827822.1 outer membrane protein assembly factor BamD [Muribacter muris]TFV11156.1 outer membrane protein assembly factor BamD [Muribacter muris]
MRKFSSFVSIILAGLVMAGCSNSNKNEFDGVPAQDLYNKGQTYLQDGDYNNAIRHLEAVDLRAHGGAYGEQTQLSIIYAQYKVGEYYKALDAAERFARSYPNSASMDYVYYLAGLSNARLGDNWIQDFFGVNRSSRSIENIRNAYGNFQMIVKQYPNSQYAQDAQRWMAYLLNRLAEHELKIAQYYMKRDAYVAVANRVEEMMRFYPDSKPTADALPLLQKSFEAMGINDSAQKVAALIEANKAKTFPDTTKPEYAAQF